MKAILSIVLRYFSNLWMIGVIFITIQWILVYFYFYPVESRWIALGFFPPFWSSLIIIPPFCVYFIQGCRKRWLSTIAFALTFFILFGDIAIVKQDAHRFSAEEKTQSLSIAAINTRYYSYGFDKVVNVFKEIDADLYLLSENDISQENVKILKERIHPYFFHMGRREGTAIISRYPVVSFKEILFPTHQASLKKANVLAKQHLNPNRSFVHAVIDVNGTPVNAISVRFLAGRPYSRSLSDVLRWSFYVLDGQIKELQLFENYLKEIKGPIIFGGDLNATPSSITLRRLSETAVDLYLQDHIWGGFTFWTNFPSYARLDYIFVKNNVQPQRSEKMHTIVSDHYPVYAEVLIPGKVKE